MTRAEQNQGTGIPMPEDHDVLYVIYAAIARWEDDYQMVTRASESVEFYDPHTEQWYEVVVRAIDEPSR